MSQASLKRGANIKNCRNFQLQYKAIDCWCGFATLLSLSQPKSAALHSRQYLTIDWGVYATLLSFSQPKSAALHFRQYLTIDWGVYATLLSSSRPKSAALHFRQYIP